MGRSQAFEGCSRTLQRQQSSDHMGFGNNESSCSPEGVSLAFLDADLHMMWHSDVRNKGYIKACEVYVAVERAVTCELTASQKAKKS